MSPKKQTTKALSPETFATAEGKQTGTCGSSGAAVSVLGLEHNEADHDGDETYGGDHQGEDDGRRRVAQLLDGAVHEEPLVEFHKPSLHQRVGPRDQQAVGYLLRAVAQVTVKAAGGGDTIARSDIFMRLLPKRKRFFFMRAPAAGTTHPFTLRHSQWSVLLSCSIEFINFLKHFKLSRMSRQSIEFLP